MIELSLTELAVWAIGIAMAAVVVLEWSSRSSARSSERESVRRRVTCRLCLLVMEDEKREPVFRCPHCGAENERDRGKNLG